MSRIVRFHQSGGPEVLQLDEVDVPAPKRGEIRLAVRALGLNRAESMFRSGQYLEDPKFPARLGYEAAGTIEALGEGVEGFAVGDAVSTIPAFMQNDYGVYGEIALVPASAVAKHPSALSWEEAAAIWMQYATAYGALIDLAKLQPGETVLLPAASSSVGLAAIQIANLVGATPVALTRTGDKRQALLDAGAAHVIATEEQDLAAEVLKLTGGKGARVIFDPVAGPTLAKLAAAAADHGIIFQYGALSPEPAPFPLLEVLGKSLTIRGYLLFEITTDPARLAQAKAVHHRRPRFREIEAGDRESFPRARHHRGGAPLPREQPAGRQNSRPLVGRERSTRVKLFPAVLGAAWLCLLTGCSTLRVADFQNGRPLLDPTQFFSGRTVSSGVMENRRGHPIRRVVTRTRGEWEGDTLRLEQELTFNDDPPQHRSWRIRRLDAHRYSATANDVVGTAIGEASGNVFHWSFPLALSPGNPLATVRMTQWMYLQPDGRTLLNHTTITKLGLVVAQVTEQFRKEE